MCTIIALVWHSGQASASLANALESPYTSLYMNTQQILQIKEWLGTGSINIFGRPFAGKDTQGEKLAQLFDGVLMGGGDILRNSTIPEHLDAILHRGELIPSDDYVAIVLPYLSKEEYASRPLLLSSVGRWIGEEQGVMAATKAAQHPLKCVLYIDIDEAMVMQRWSALESHDDRGGRYDDTAEILQKRLEEYRSKTLPVIEEYDRLGLLERIDGHGTPEEVHELILACLLRRATSQ
ncbi:hypothetical protein RAAC3_TM7C00001G0209 [Candidatus Saccharibacteria bacterium RAAC3_TM7_1]|nr:hypothetical protein RAAC3_TM7C00001G0209 [Candidatus Saccharibacteria bacterium RAAC3_TM7_1]